MGRHDGEQRCFKYEQLELFEIPEQENSHLCHLSRDVPVKPQLRSAELRNQSPSLTRDAWGREEA